MHSFREPFRDARKSAALPRTYPLPRLRVLVNRPYFSLLFFILLPRHEWLVEEAKWKSKDFLLLPLLPSASRRAKHRPDLPSLPEPDELPKHFDFNLFQSRLCKMKDVRLVAGRFFVAFKLVNWRRYCNSAAHCRSCLHSKLYSWKKWSRIK